MAADDELRKMERYLSEIFSQAEKDLIQKSLKYMADFERKDKAKLKKVESGEITDDEYKEWRKNQLLYGEHWTRLIQLVQKEMVNVNQTALDYINDKTTQIYADSYNSIATVIKQSPVEGYSFELVDANTVKNLAKEEGIILPPKKNLDVQKDKLWNAKQVNAQLLQGILQGEDIPHIAGRMAKVCESNKSASIRNARTMVTAAENSGRQSGMNKAESDGIIFKKMWIATRDERTRESHMVLNGQLVNNGEKFVTINGDEIEFPGDWRAKASEVYNCRCTLGTIVTGFKKVKLEETIQKQQEVQVEQQDEIIEEISHVEYEHNIVQGRDLSLEWQRRPDEFAFEIEDVINAQGFDGLPRIVSEEEFNEAVRQSGFIAQRAYSAVSQEIVDEYQRQLYYGSWYVDCGTGGAQYGQGMYCAADYTGTLTQGILNEMEHYRNLGQNRMKELARSEYIANLSREDLRGIYTKDFIDTISDEELKVLLKFYDPYVTLADTSEEEKKIYQNSKYKTDIKFQIDDLSETFDQNYKSANKTETLTLSPDAKIIKYSDIAKMKYDDTVDYVVKQKLFKTYDFSDEDLALLYANYENEFSLVFNDYEKLKSIKSLSEKIGEMIPDEWNEKYDKRDTELIEFWEYELKKKAQKEVSAAKKRAEMDDGTWAALMGYDAINAEGHGESGSYTVILNRTKVIFKEET